MKTAYTAENKQEVINEYITAVYAVKKSDWYEQTNERQKLIETLASEILKMYER